jgi:hypothetical protein
MKENTFTEDEGLVLIQQMINAAKQEQKDDGKGWIIWGWIIFLASILTYFNLKFEWFSPFFFWNVFGAITILLLVIRSVRYFFIRSVSKVTTYTNALFQKLNSGFFISLMLIIVSMNTGGVHPTKGFALLLGLYGFWILIYGAVLNFRPSIIGAYITWVFAFVSLFVPSFDWTMLLHAVAVLCGYIIPGHIAYKEFGKVKR